jgi:hypothetical protein
MSTHIKHQPFIDLMKAFGMWLIILGHLIGDPHNPYNLVTQPAFTKQIGVAFFVFVTGWGLANETRPAVRAVFNRFFPFLLFGVAFAIFISVLHLITRGDTNPSNYLPFFLGANVLFNNFPANPTTWYIGTYLHILIFWYFFLRGKQVTIGHLLAAFIFENIVRCIFIAMGKDFIAYMLLPNWLTSFMLGMYLHDKRQLPSSPFVIVLLAAWIFVFIMQTWIGNLIGFTGTFPFRHMDVHNTFSVPIESLMISATYIIHTLIFFEIARRLPGSSIVTFMAKATLITVIIHMPIIYAAHSYFYNMIEDPIIARLVFALTLFIGTAIISWLILRAVNVKALSERSWKILTALTDKYLSRT